MIRFARFHLGRLLTFLLQKVTQNTVVSFAITKGDVPKMRISTYSALKADQYTLLILRDELEKKINEALTRNHERPAR